MTLPLNTPRAGVWIELKTGPKTSSAILSVIPAGPYIVSPQFAEGDYKDLSWEKALERQAKVGDRLTDDLEVLWATVVFANESGKAVKVAYYYDTSD